jgi:hypothetical protein
MSIPRLAGRFLGASLLGLAFVAACAGAAPGAPGPVDPSSSTAAPSGATVEPLTPGLDPAHDPAPLGRNNDSGKSPDAGPPTDAGDAPRCPYGELNDPHRGFVRCLLPDERDAGWLPPPSQPPAPPSTGAPIADAGPPADAGKDIKPAGPPPTVELGTPVYENGEVPKAKMDKALNAATADIGKCVAEHGGLSGASGSLKVQFLVRSRGRAEGVEILASKGVSAEAAACVRLLLKNKPIGSPTADPVGVTLTISLKPGSR